MQSKGAIERYTLGWHSVPWACKDVRHVVLTKAGSYDASCQEGATVSV